MNQNPQTVVLDNEQTAALFTEEGKVFYDLEALVAIMLQDLMARKVATEQTGPLSEHERFFVAGQADVLRNLNEQVKMLRMQYQAFRTLEGGNTLADFGFTGEDGTLS